MADGTYWDGSKWVSAAEFRRPPQRAVRSRPMQQPPKEPPTATEETENVDGTRPDDPKPAVDGE